MAQWMVNDTSCALSGSLGRQETAIAYSMMTLCVLGSLANLLMMMSIARHQRTNPSGNPQTRAHYRLLINLFVADFLMCTVNAPIFGKTTQLSAMDSQGSACLVQGVSSITFAAASILFLACIAYDRFCTIVRESVLDIKRQYALMCAVWLYALLLGALLLLAPPFGIVVTSSCIFCSSRFYQSGIGALHAYLCIATLFVAVATTGWMYFRILRKVQQTTRNVLASSQSTQSHFHRNARTSQTKLAFRMFLLVVLFALNWCLYLVKMLYEVSTRTPTSTVFDAVATLMGFTNSLSNPLLYLFLNRHKYLSRTVVRSYSGPPTSGMASPRTLSRPLALPRTNKTPAIAASPRFAAGFHVRPFLPPAPAPPIRLVNE